MVSLNRLTMRNPWDDYHDEWMEWCDFNGPDGYHGFSPEDGEAQLPVSKCTAVVAAEEMTVPVRCKQDSWVGYICFCNGYRPRAGNRLFGAPCYWGPTEMGDSRIPDFPVIRQTM